MKGKDTERKARDKQNKKSTIIRLSQNKGDSASRVRVNMMEERVRS